MALKTKVLVENITNLSEARYCAGMGVHFLSFPAQYVDPKMYKDITGWIQGPEMAIEFSAAINNQFDLSEYDTKLIIFSIQEERSQFPSLSRWIIRVTPQDWYANNSFLVENKTKIDFLLFDLIDTSPMSVNAIQEASKEFRLFASAQQIPYKELLTWPIEGIALRGSNETKVGLKDYDHLSSVLEGLEIQE
jgi:phosphoribosylanthranilate isomerase